MCVVGIASVLHRIRRCLSFDFNRDFECIHYPHIFHYYFVGQMNLSSVWYGKCSKNYVVRGIWVIWLFYNHQNPFEKQRAFWTGHFSQYSCCCFQLPSGNRTILCGLHKNTWYCGWNFNDHQLLAKQKHSLIPDFGIKYIDSLKCDEYSVWKMLGIDKYQHERYIRNTVSH